MGDANDARLERMERIMLGLLMGRNQDVALVSWFEPQVPVG
jgi:hypothetical protein